MSKELTLRERIAQLNEKDRDDVQSNLRSAIYHLASCWDALRNVENVVKIDIETDEIECCAGDVTDPFDAFKKKLDDILDWMEIASV